MSSQALDKLSPENNFALDTRILIVDDSPTMLRSLRVALEELGYHNIVEASDGSIAWEMLVNEHEINQPFGLVLCDLKMEEMGGIELLMILREDFELSETPFLIVTGHGELSQVIAAAQAKVSAYLVKPVKADALEFKLKQVYERLSKKS